MGDGRGREFRHVNTPKYTQGYESKNTIWEIRKKDAVYHESERVGCVGEGRNW